MRKRILVIGAMALLPAVVAGQSGFGGIVSDPIQEGHSAEQLVNDIQKINQLIRTYNQITATYNQIAYAATYLRQKSAWLGIATRMVNSNTLVLLCYKRREPQKGQQGSCRKSARAMV